MPHEQVDAEVAKRFAQRDGSQPAMSTGGDAFTRSRNKTPRTFAKVKKRAKGAIQAPSRIKDVAQFFPRTGEDKAVETHVIDFRA